jgi:hypothetical protein
MTDADFLTEKNNQILSLATQLGDARLYIKKLESRVTALQHANDRLASDLAASDRFIDRINEKLTGFAVSKCGLEGHELIGTCQACGTIQTIDVDAPV